MNVFFLIKKTRIGIAEEIINIENKLPWMLLKLFALRERIRVWFDI